MVLISPTIDSIISLALVIIGIALVLFVVMKIGKVLVKVVVGFVMNAILGFIALFAIGYFFGITVPYTFPVIASVVLFGLPGVGTLLILKLGGIVLAIL